ncbi:MAG: PrsW family glutamic-type intramembrane protease [Chloroflexi bacterium]|nr:PrsW family glutamic-type intramembrane protease [Chloroflexota bacterium]
MNVSRDRQSLWRSGIIELIGLLAYVVIVEAVVALAKPSFGEEVLAPLGISLALIPAVLWLAFFYAQDRAEPEPRTYVIAVAILGALLAAAVGQPLINDFFRAPGWIGRDTVTEILGSILVIGFIQEFLKYATVRFSIYYSNEFDQRVDGVIYGTAAGVGYATMLNIMTVINSGGIAGDELSAGVIRIVVTALAQGALGGLLGYFIARTKFDDEPVWWMPLGLTLAATINGLFSWVSGEITRAPITIDASGLGSGGYNPWPALVLATVIAILLFGAVFVLIRRANRLTLAGADTDER